MMNSVLWIVLAVLLCLVILGLPLRIDVDHYDVVSDKVDKEFCICVLSDLHCVKFGRNQKRIRKLVDENVPDLIIIPGDLFDVDRNYDNSFMLIDQLKSYPIYYTSGNHDMYLVDEIDGFREKLRTYGVNVLEDDSVQVPVCGNEIEIAGIADHGRKMIYSVEECHRMYQSDGFRILISHRPDYLSFYEKISVDLIICGHDHGGQWRIPFTHQGIIAPQRGFFPKYTEGVHPLGHSHLAISRGLASGNPRIPRLFNNPEIMMLHVKRGK